MRQPHTSEVLGKRRVGVEKELEPPISPIKKMIFLFEKYREAHTIPRYAYEGTLRALAAVQKNQPPVRKTGYRI
jgi:hypothetical protein